MKFNNPIKYIPDEEIDGHLVARGEIVIEGSVNGTNWSSILEDAEPWRYIRLSYDGGTTWAKTLDLTAIPGLTFESSFIITNSLIPEDDTGLEHFDPDYPIQVDILIDSYELFKNRPVSVYLKEPITGNNNVYRYKSVLTPVVFNDADEMLYLLFTSEFITSNLGKTIVVKI